MKISKLLIPVLLICFAACSHRKAIAPQTKIEKIAKPEPIPLPAVPVGWKSVDTESFVMLYPVDWELNQSGLMGSTFIVFSPMESLTDQFRENINLIKQDLSQQRMSLDQFVELSITQINTIITDSEILSNERKKKNGLEYQETIYTGKQGIYNLRFEQNYWVVNDKAYILTFTSTVDSYDEYKSAGNTMLNSFTLKFRK